MKTKYNITPTDLKLKLARPDAINFFDYLLEIAKHWDDYIKIIISDRLTQELMKYNLQVVGEKVRYLLFGGTQLVTLRITHAERLTLNVLFSNYSLPAHLLDIDYKIKNGLIL